MTKQSKRDTRKKRSRHTVNSRWVIGAVVAVAVVAVLAIKFARDAKGASLAEQPPLDLTSTAAGVPAQPLPQGPAAQVDWILENGQPAMLLFRSTDCRPCIEMHRLVTKVRGDYERDVFFIDVIVSDTANYELIRRMGVRMIPTSFFVGRDGRAGQAIGVLSEMDLRAALESLRGGP